MLLIDGDIISYRTAFSKEAESLEEYKSVADGYIKNIIKNADPFIKDYTVFLSGSGNFRKQVAVTKEYKGNRTAEKPEHLEAIRTHLLTSHPSDLSDNEEADDRIAIEATRVGIAAIICSIDKDFDQVPGWHYNFVKFSRYLVTKKEALLNFYCQILTGDRIDNVQGIRGIGPKKACKHLQEFTTELEMFNKCVELFESRDRVIENATLLWLRRTPGEMWSPPDEREHENAEEAKGIKAPTRV